MKNMIIKKLAEEARGHLNSLNKTVSLLKFDDNYAVRNNAGITQALVEEVDASFRELEYVLRNIE